MIQRLYIKDFAIIDEIDINFKPGLTVITGETGSGKSILLQALSVSLGAKADKIMVRNGSQRAVIETEFKDREIRRLISDQGRTKAYQNDEPITLANLIKMNETRVDFHGQHDQQLILDSNRHIDYLDRYCGHEREVNSLEDTYRELNDLRSKLDRLHQSAEETRDRLDLLKFQATEIDAVDPKIGEDFKFDQLYKKLSHIEEILRTLQKAHSKLSTEDHSLLDQLSNTVQALASLEKYDLELTKITDLLKSSIIQLQEAGSEITSQLSESEFEPDELSIIEDRLNALETLKRKYGGSIESVLERRKFIQEELQTLKNPEQSEKALIEIIKEKEKMFSMTAISVHKKRKEKSNDLSSKIEGAMEELNMPGAHFEIRIGQERSDHGFVDYNNELHMGNPKGIDTVEFFLSANPGEPVKPLAAVASGGEISRIMLAIKTVFQDMDPVKTLVFDEIDSGISGQAAERVAAHLVRLAKSKQVFCITHLSQIARQADHHLHIVKYIENDHTYVELKYLNEVESPKVIQELFVGTETASA